jgi:hypothetical protein
METLLQTISKTFKAAPKTENKLKRFKSSWKRIVHGSKQIRNVDLTEIPWLLEDIYKCLLSEQLKLPQNGNSVDCFNKGLWPMH